MTKDEALQLALDSMKEIIHWYAVRDRNDVFLNFVDQNPEIQKIMKSITAIKETLETKEGLLDRKSYLLGLYDQKSRLELETKDEPVSDKLERLLWEFIDLKAMHPNHNPDPRTWPHVFAYAPKPNHLVAWGMEKDGVILDVICPAEHEREEGSYTVPLYTSPQIKTKDEPVALVAEVHISRYTIEWTNGPLPQGTKLYTTPQRTFVGLTDEDMNKALDYWSDDSRSAYGGAHSASGEYVDMIETWRYIEAMLKEKNNYA